jgi:hypothetical protein
MTMYIAVIVVTANDSGPRLPGSIRGSGTRIGNLRPPHGVASALDGRAERSPQPPSASSATTRSASSAWRSCSSYSSPFPRPSPPYPPDDLLVGPKLLDPTLKHPFGTDDLGRDMLSRVCTALASPSWWDCSPSPSARSRNRHRHHRRIRRHRRAISRVVDMMIAFPPATPVDLRQVMVRPHRRSSSRSASPSSRASRASSAARSSRSGTTSTSRPRSRWARRHRASSSCTSRQTSPRSPSSS